MHCCSSTVLPTLQVRSDMERQMAQAQTLAVQEALKEANLQSNSKEVSRFVQSCFKACLPVLRYE